MMNKKIFVIEDDPDINRLLCRILQRSDYQVLPAFSGTEAKLVLELEKPDLILLDLMLPGMTGEELISFIRKEKNIQAPILILSAKHALENKIETLTLGADDYLTKPFEPEEVLVRVMALLRRAQTTQQPERKDSDRIEGMQTAEESKTELRYKNLMLCPDSRAVFVREKEVFLTPHEYDILLILMRQPEKVFSRETLYEKVWQNGYYGEDNTVNVHVSNIRKKIAARDADNEYIRTVWGIGFKLA
ncbi:MAG: response regulator transcription factor [Marvinbryantia sp.]|jgi:DNA-binding response OmpR family regulator